MIISSEDVNFIPGENVYANAGNEHRIRQHARFCVANGTDAQVKKAVDALVTAADMRPVVRRIFAEEYRKKNSRVTGEG